MRAFSLTALVALAANACATPSLPPPSSSDDAIARYDRPAPDAPASVTIAGERADAPDRVASRRVAPDPPPRRRSRRIDVHLHGATLMDALRFLAEAGGFGLVIDDALTTPVSLDLVRADPRGAFDALAQAHGVEVIWSGDVAIVRAR